MEGKTMRTKRVLSMVMSVLLLLSLLAGCGISDKNTDGQQETTTAASTQKSQETTAQQAAGKPDVLEITKVSYFGDATDTPELKQEWTEAMEREFGIKFKVNYPPRNNYMEKVNLMITSGELKGLVYLFSPDDMMKAINDGAIEPLDDYLKDNPVWNSLPDTMRELYQVKGQTWAIPNGLSGAFFTRSIRTDWLDNLGMKVPETVDELYEVAKAFTLNDPDKNGKNDTIGLTSSGTWNLQDIFQAFDARLNHIGENSITWDPGANAFIDTMLKPEMAEALQYLNNLYKNGFLDKELFTNKGSNMREKMMSGLYGSTFYWQHYSVDSFEPAVIKVVPTAKFEEITALKGKLTRNINQVTYGNAPYVLIKGTKQAKEVVNEFINIFFGNEKGHFMGRYGIPGKTFDLKDKTITFLVDKDGNGYTHPDIIVELPSVFSVESMPMQYKTMSVIATPEQQAVLESNLKRKAEGMKNGLESGLLFQLGTKYTTPVSDTFATISPDVKRLFDEAVVKAVTGELTPEQAVKNYREQMKNIGAQQILDECNQNLGATTDMKY